MAKAATEKNENKRSQVVGVRLDPRTRYLAEIAARVQRRSLSGFIEIAILEALERQQIRPREKHSLSVADVAHHIWSPSEARRFIALATQYAELLSYEEQMMWAAIEECPYFWEGRWGRSDNVRGQDDWYWDINNEHALKHDLVVEQWSLLQKIGAGLAKAESLPKREMTRISVPGRDADFDDDIPF
jgi:uncharacterized protein (DUF1778 family)